MADVLLFLAIGTAIFAAAWFGQWLIKHRAESWYEVPGRIESGEVSGIRDPRGSLFTARLSYSYSVNNEWFAGQVKRSFSDEQKAWDFVDRLRGKALSVRYNPRKPEKSVIWRMLDGV